MVPVPETTVVRRPRIASPAARVAPGGGAASSVGPSSVVASDPPEGSQRPSEGGVAQALEEPGASSQAGGRVQRKTEQAETVVLNLNLLHLVGLSFPLALGCFFVLGALGYVCMFLFMVGGGIFAAAVLLVVMASYSAYYYWKAPKAKGGVSCTRCGHHLRAGMLFCPNCGAKRPEEPKPKACEQCGAKLAADAMFCSRCGARRPSD
uniref:DZANK-type domain-containing protein n=1 Tax=Alexandrium catenella TaxID=2925 RepID=A0A7S1SF95_ALECA